MYQNFIIPYLYEAQHVSGDTQPIIRSLKLHSQPLVLHKWRVVGRVVAERCKLESYSTWRPTTLHVCKTRGCECSFRFLMMGGVSPKTCWASYKYGIKFWYTIVSCWIFLCELYVKFGIVSILALCGRDRTVNYCFCLQGGRRKNFQISVGQFKRQAEIRMLNFHNKIYMPPM